MMGGVAEMVPILRCTLPLSEPIARPRHLPPACARAPPALLWRRVHLPARALHPTALLRRALTHVISETHVLHYHAWSALGALRTRLAATGLRICTRRRAAGPPHPDHLRLQGRYHASRFPLPDMLSSAVIFFTYFVEDESNVMFYQDAHGRAACQPIYLEGVVSDPGTDLAAY